MIKITVVDLMSIVFKIHVYSCTFRHLAKGGANIFPKFTYKKVNY